MEDETKELREQLATVLRALRDAQEQHERDRRMIDWCLPRMVVDDDERGGGEDD